jgi:hypothetical protein
MSPRAGAWLALLLPLSAASAVAAEETLVGCRRIDDAGARLACYDRVVDRVAAEEAQAAPVKASLALPTEAVDGEPQRERMFGRSSAAKARALERNYGIATPDRLTARVTGVTRSADRLVVITLENGQVWRQSESGSFLIGAGDSAEIEAGALGAYYLRRDGKGRAIRVKRVQ